jgi:hypothetical protein
MNEDTLIAAAPELLDALRAFFNMHNTGRIVLHPDTPRDVRETVYVLVRRAGRAIEIAEGKR